MCRMSTETGLECVVQGAGTSACTAHGTGGQHKAYAVCSAPPDWLCMLNLARPDLPCPQPTLRLAVSSKSVAVNTLFNFNLFQNVKC